MSRVTKPVAGLGLVLAGLLLLFEGFAVLFILTGYRFSPVEGIERFVRSPSGMLFLIALPSLVVTGWFLIRHVRRLPPPAKRPASLTLGLNLITVVLALIAGEGSLRLLHAIGMRLPSLHIAMPALRTWEGTAGQFLATLQGSTTLYHDFDPELGWTIAKSRSSQNGLYVSSSEGLRSARPGESMLTWSKDTRSPHSSSSSLLRVALIGDSFTFGYEVSYEETWAARLSLQLGSDYELVNFGVIGYSVNQMRLKYERDVRPFHPDVVVVGVISHDFLRDTFIYNFLPYPDMLALPYARPRPVLRNGRLELLNTPLISPSEIFNTDSVHHLPFLQFDVNYNPIEWERPAWRLLQRSLLFRTVAARPAWPPETRTALFDQEQHELNRAVLRSLADSIRNDGSIPIFLFFPDPDELPDMPGHPGTIAPPYGTSILTEVGLGYEDLTACVRTISPDHRFLPGRHYSAETNTALASCLPSIIRNRISESRPQQALLTGQR